MGQRGRLPVQALGYVNSIKVIFGLPETAGVHFLLRPHASILQMIAQFRNGRSTEKYALIQFEIDAPLRVNYRELIFVDGYKSKWEFFATSWE